MTLGADIPADRNEQLSQKRKRRRVRGFCLIASTAVLASATWYIAWRTASMPAMPAPPTIDLTGMDPELSDAIRAAANDVEKSPRSADAWGRLGMNLRSAEFNQEASFCFEQAEKLEPTSVRWTYLRGEALLLQNPAAAAASLRRAVELCDRYEPDNVIPRLRLAETLMHLGYPDEAKDVLLGTLDRDSDNPVARLYLGILAGPEGDWKEARRLLLSCQFSEFTRQRACLELARLCEQIGNSDEAAQFEKKAAELPKDFNWPDKYVMDYKQSAAGKQTRLQYVDRLEMLGKRAEALDALREIAAEGPDYRVLTGIGRLLGRAGDLAGAESALREAIRLTDANAKAQRLLSGVLLSQGDELKRKGGDSQAPKERFTAALQAARRALAQKADDTESFVFQGLALERLGQKEAALSSFESAVACGPDLPEAHFYLAEALSEAGKSMEARPHWQQVVNLAKPDHPHRKIALEKLR
jgi:tetratricopeptide (TPR) repeat protein